MNVDRKIKLPDLILSTVLLSKQIFYFKLFFRKKGKILELCDFKNEAALEFSLQIGYQKPQLSDFDSVCKANNGI